MKKILNLTSLLLLSGLVHATETGTFGVKVINANGANMAVNISNYMIGWNCASGSSLDYQELLPDHKGVEKFNTRSKKGSSGHSLFEKGEMSMTLQKDMSSQSRIIARVSETCNRLKEDEDGNTVSDVKTFSWSCEFDTFPTALGATSNTTCKPDKNLYSTTFELTALMNILKNTTFNAEIKLLNKEEKYLANFCTQDNLHNKKIIKISQGLDHFKGENDFNISLNISGIPQEINIQQKNGVINEEIAICTTEDVEVTVAAYEKDLIWNDVYKCDPANGGKARLSTRRPGLQTAFVDFKRPGLLSKLFLDDSRVKLEVRSSPGVARAPAVK